MSTASRWGRRQPQPVRAWRRGPAGSPTQASPSHAERTSRQRGAGRPVDVVDHRDNVVHAAHRFGGGPTAPGPDTAA